MTTKSIDQNPTEVKPRWVQAILDRYEKAYQAGLAAKAEREQEEAQKRTERCRRFIQTLGVEGVEPDHYEFDIDGFHFCYYPETGSASEYWHPERIVAFGPCEKCGEPAPSLDITYPNALAKFLQNPTYQHAYGNCPRDLARLEEELARLRMAPTTEERLIAALRDFIAEAQA